MKKYTRISAIIMTVALLLCALVLIVSADEWKSCENENLAKTMGTAVSDMNGFSVTLDVCNDEGLYPYSVSVILTNKPDNYDDISEYILAIPGEFQGSVNEKCDSRLGFLWDNYIYMEEYSFVITLLDDLYTPQLSQGTAGDGVYDVVTYSVIRWGELENSKLAPINVPANEPIVIEPRYYYDEDEEANTLTIDFNGETLICAGFSDHWTHQVKLTLGVAAHALQDPDQQGIPGLEGLVYTTDFEILDICGESPEEFDGYTDTTCEHVWSEPEHMSNWPAVCSKKGKTESWCENCGWVDRVFVAPLAHTWGETQIITPASCTADGKGLNTCTVCGGTEDVVLPGGHAWGEWTVVTEPTCGAEGEQTSTCSVCGETETVAIPALEHAWGEWTVESEATCGAEGEEKRVCANCEEAETQAIPATGEHAWGDWEEIKAPTATEPGIQQQTCSVCGATQTEELPIVDPGAQIPFIDVPEGQWYTDAIIYCYENGYMAGVSETEFGRKTNVNRAMFVTILYAIDGGELEEDDGYIFPFEDVAEGKWYYEAIKWAAKNGYASGIGEGLFGVKADVTRETIAQFFYTYSKMNGIDVEAEADLSVYTDLDRVHDWALDAVEWAVAKELISGTSATTLAPRASATRAEIAVIIKGYVENIKNAEPNEPITPPVDDTPAATD